MYLLRLSKKQGGGGGGGGGAKREGSDGTGAWAT
jgi:hypothetical protein